MEGRDSGVVCLGSGSWGRQEQQRTAETKETYGALKQSMFYFVALKYV